MSNIRVEVAAGVATITLDRPAALNAFTSPMIADFLAAIDRTDADDEVRAVVVTGAGRGFCAGADLSAGTDTFDRQVGDEVFRDGAGMVSMRLFRSRIPLIAAIIGPAVGIGASLTLAMDIRLAADTAKFGFLFARRGIVPDGASSWFLPRIVGVGTAAEWMLTGRMILADEASRAGLVTGVHPADGLLPAAYAIAREIAECTAPVSVAMTRRLLWIGLGESHPMAAHRRESQALRWCGANADSKEGVGAYLEKRAPRFPLTVSRDLPTFFDMDSEPSFSL